MKRAKYKLFSQGRIAHLSIKNRLVRSATCESGVTEDGRVTPQILNLYRTLANGGVGMIITGHLAVSRKGKGHDRQTCIYDDCHVAEIAQIAEVVHGSSQDCKIIAQLSYAGRQVFHDNNVAECVGPSDVPSPILRNRARVLSASEVEKIIDCFSVAIMRVKKGWF